MTRSETLKAAQSKYEKETIISKRIKLNKEKDADIIEFLQKQENMTEVIKTCIREYIENHEV